MLRTLYRIDNISFNQSAFSYCRRLKSDEDRLCLKAFFQTVTQSDVEGVEFLNAGIRTIRVVQCRHVIEICDDLVTEISPVMAFAA